MLTPTRGHSKNRRTLLTLTLRSLIVFGNTIWRLKTGSKTLYLLFLAIDIGFLSINPYKEHGFSVEMCPLWSHLLRGGLSPSREPKSGGEREGCLESPVPASYRGGFL